MKKFLLGLFLAVTCFLVTPNLSNAASGNNLPKQTEVKVTEKKVTEKKVRIGTQNDLATIPSESIQSIKKVVEQDVIIIIIETDDEIIIIIIVLD